MSSPCYDEMRSATGELRSHYRAFADWLERTSPDRIAQKREEAERAFHRVGITFAVYGDDGGTERTIPFFFSTTLRGLSSAKIAGTSVESS